MLARSYMKAWFDVGPSPRETYQELADTFFGHTRAALDAEKAHYDGNREGFQKNLEAKQALDEEFRSLLEEEVKEAAAWPAQAEKVKDVQKRWKLVGFAGRKDDQEVWEQFRGLCDLFFQKRDAAFADVRAAQGKIKERKQAIAEEAVALAESQDWKVTSDKLIALQKEWKELGSAGPRDENKLWRKFRGACDQFFTARAIYADRQGAQGPQKKEALISEIEATNSPVTMGKTSRPSKPIPPVAEWPCATPGLRADRRPLPTPWTPSMTPSEPSAVNVPSKPTRAVWRAWSEAKEPSTWPAKRSA